MALAAGCARPCDPIASSPAAARLGVVLEGGRVCKEDNLVVSVDYPDAKPDELAPRYVRSLQGAGWRVDAAGRAAVLATRAGDSVLVVTGRDEKERRVPFAVVRYCSDAECRARLEELARAMR